MATFRERLADFICDRYPDEEIPVEALCKDNNKTYVIPYACCRFDDEWRNFETDETVAAEGSVGGLYPRGGDLGLSGSDEKKAGLRPFQGS